MLDALRALVCAGNKLLPRAGLVTWTSGNVSGRDRETGLVVIKPSGVRYDDLTPEQMVILDLDGRLVEGTLKPSVDAPTHLYVYRHRPDVMGIVHTHSTFATAFPPWASPSP
ncbi:MAG: class II aldolase/adducin family protein, partial [Chloroflexi bacterium]|nr:class II aldolase/adducin family protein [Chloroflexota bacterium]